MEREKVVLTAAQVSTLVFFVDSYETWPNVSGLDEAVLGELEREAYIVWNRTQKNARITASGRLAIGNHVVTGTPEHGQMLLERDGRRAPEKPYGGVMRKSGGDIPARMAAPEEEETLTQFIPTPNPSAIPQGLPLVAGTSSGRPQSGEGKKVKAKPCVVVGCSEPRMTNSKGKLERHCREHQQEYWRETARKQRERKHRNGLVEASAVIAAEEQQNPLPALSRSEGGQSRVCETCGDCVHREVLELLRARYPKIDELADAVTRVRALADALGIG